MPHSVESYHLPRPERWAVENARKDHNDALYAFGEYSMLALMWRVEDHDDGLVARCPRCYRGDRAAKAYGQSSENKCPDCFGTTFEGGYKAKVVRPCLWDTGPSENLEQGKRGEIVQQSATVQTPSDVRMRDDDYIFRADGSRWWVRSTGSQTLRTGFEFPSQVTTSIAWTYSQTQRVDEDMAIYKMDPSEAVLRARLNVVGEHFPVDFTDLEDIRGPVIF